MGSPLGGFSWAFTVRMYKGDNLLVNSVNSVHHTGNPGEYDALGKQFTEVTGIEEDRRAVFSGTIYLVIWRR